MGFCDASLRITQWLGLEHYRFVIGAGVVRVRVTDPVSHGLHPASHLTHQRKPIQYRKVVTYFNSRFY